MATGTRLAVGGLVVVTTMVYLAYLLTSTGWSYYVTVDECLLNASELLGEPVRVSGKVAAGSLSIGPSGREATFLLAGAAGSLRVRCPEAVPDNLAERREVVVEGRMDSKTSLVAHTVLTRCASKYASPTADTAAAPIARD